MGEEVTSLHVYVFMCRGKGEVTNYELQGGERINHETHETHEKG